MGPKRLFGLAVITAAILSLRTTVASDATPSAGVSNERARFGVAILDLDGQSRKVLHADERFAMCSTFKVLAAALVLTRVDRGEERLDRRIVYAKDRVVSYSPETEKHSGDEGMTLGEICKAGLTLSDNTAANLILESFGGQPEFTRLAAPCGVR